MVEGFALFIGFIVAAIISPLLTFTALFQMKEWRVDRLKEHLRREGYFSSLFGTIRPVIFALYLVIVLWMASDRSVAADSDLPAYDFIFMTMGLLLLLVGLSAVQILTGRQRSPVWTSKAIVITTFAGILSVLAVLGSATHIVAFPFALAAQPLYVLAAWLIFLPVDGMMKRRVMNKAKMLRSSMKDITVIGIAGSVGKTTTKELIKHLLQDLSPLSTPAHVNTEMGVAGWLLSVRARHASPLIIEMGAYRKGEIALLCQITQPTIGVMTALGSDHLALFGSEEAIVDTNAELIESLPADGHAFLDGLNTSSASLATRAHCPVTVTHGPHDVQETPQGLSFSLGDVRHEVALHGKHNIANVLLAVAVAKHLKITDARIKELLKTFRPLAHTFNVRTEGTVTLLDDTYNLSPLSMKAGIEWATAQSNRPRVLLTSGLQEAGDAEAEHLSALGKQASDCIERIIFTTTAGADSFATGYGKPVETLNKDTQRIPEGAVLVALGRMPLSTIQRLLPSS